MSETRGAVSFRPLRADDRDRLLEWRNLPDVATYMYTDHRISASEHANWFKLAISDPTRRYWVIELEGEPVGLASLYDISVMQRRAYLALYLAEDHARGRGVGLATDRFLMRHAFVDLGLEKLCAEALSSNERGVNVHLHFGFHVDGVLRQHVLKAGHRVDVVTMSLLRDEWTKGQWAASG
jgi:UDP-4-amino-4,6-dideoxy-N-acetyl-beta-L-altrosamine N-acetyltransferase